jgi:hypothetical protein
MKEIFSQKPPQSLYQTGFTGIPRKNKNCKNSFIK